MTDPDRHSVRRVVLPSGKTIEVVYFEDAPPAGVTAAEAPASSPVDGIHVCPGCRSKLVYPLDWVEAGERHWEMTLRCPDCEWIGSGIHTLGVVEAFEEALDLGTEQLVHDLRRLTQANMEEDVARFAAALAADALLPEDF